MKQVMRLSRWEFRIKLARTQAELEKLVLQQGFQDLRAEAADLFLEAILQRELLEVQKSSYEYMYQLSQSDSLRYVSGEITENDVRQSKLETVTLLNTVPLTFSNINKGAVKAAKFRIAQSEIMERDMELQIQAEITQAWFNYEAEKKKIAQYKAGVLEDSQKVLDGMVYKYKRGETSILDVLVAQRTYNEVQQEYLETMKGYAASLVALESACGIWDI